MCNGLGGFYHRSGQTFFVEPDDVGDVSHGAVLSRMPKKYHKDDDLVPFEFPDWTEKSFHWDHPGTIPDWANKEACVQLLKQVKPIWKKYKKVHDQARAEYKKAGAQAWAKYLKVCNQAWAKYEKVRNQALAEYEEVCDQAYAEYEKAYAPALAEYEKVRDQAVSEYEKVHDQAYAEYLKVCNQAWAEYEKVRAPARAEMIDELSKIDGYLAN